MFKKLKVWWDNRKGVIEGYVLPKLDIAIPIISNLMISRGIPAIVALPIATDIIEWLKQHLKEQL